MTRELITELTNTLERMDGWLKVRHFSGLMPDEIALINAAREYLATEPSDESPIDANKDELRDETEVETDVESGLELIN